LLEFSHDLEEDLIANTGASRSPIVLHEEGDGYVYSLVCLPVLDYLALTSREREVTGLIQRGMANKAIAATLGMSPATVATHLRSIFKKLRISSRTELLVGVASVPSSAP
jgi:DNA-binding NarL/FixJ family response regulator